MCQIIKSALLTGLGSFRFSSLRISSGSEELLEVCQPVQVSTWSRWGVFLLLVSWSTASASGWSKSLGSFFLVLLRTGNTTKAKRVKNKDILKTKTKENRPYVAKALVLLFGEEVGTARLSSALVRKGERLSSLLHFFFLFINFCSYPLLYS